MSDDAELEASSSDLLEPLFEERDPLVSRILERQQKDLDNRRMFLAGAIAAALCWTTSGSVAFGFDWMVKVAIGAAVSAGLGVLLTIQGLAEFSDYVETDGPETPEWVKIGTLIGTSLLCLFVFAIYQTTCDFADHRQKTGICIGVTATGLVIGFAIGLSQRRKRKA